MEHTLKIDTDIFYFINGLSDNIPVIDEVFKGIANDYFLMVASCLILIFIWFGTVDLRERTKNQIAVLNAVIAVGLANALVALSDFLYFRVRPFNALPADSINLLYYRPTDSSFPSNFAAVLFAMAFAILFKNRKYGWLLLFIALVGGFARIYVGVHYPLDILGGAALGLFASCLAYGITYILKPVIAYILRVLSSIFLA